MNSKSNDFLSNEYFDITNIYNDINVELLTFILFESSCKKNNPKNLQIKIEEYGSFINKVLLKLTKLSEILSTLNIIGKDIIHDLKPVILGFNKSNRKNEEISSFDVELLEFISQKFEEEKKDIKVEFEAINKQLKQNGTLYAMSESDTYANSIQKKKNFYGNFFKSIYEFHKSIKEILYYKIYEFNDTQKIYTKIQKLAKTKENFNENVLKLLQLKIPFFDELQQKIFEKEIKIKNSENKRQKKFTL